MLMNLTVNAYQAVQTRLQSEPSLIGEVFITTGQHDQQLMIVITDNGCGMDETVKSRIFEPFFTTKPVGTGTGLGMAISFGIIENHRGTVEVESAVGQGTKITIFIPTSKA
jgi:signal transduction histidine kinase